MGIKERRNELGYTQQKLADLTGIQVRTLQKIEKANYGSLKNAIAIAKALNTTVEKLFYEKPSELIKRKLKEME